MARRTKAEAQETREQILDAAELCFRDVGVAHTTLAMVAARAGCTRGAIYWHFGEKYELLRKVVERAHILFYAELQTKTRNAEPIAAVHKFLQRSLEDLQSDRHLRNVIEVVLFRGECPEEISNEFAMGKDGAEKLLLLLLCAFDAGKARGEIKTGIPMETLACLAFFVFTGALRTCIFMPANSWMVKEGLTALNLIFDIAHGNTEACNECLRRDF
ncbi:TetR family transcriptional regulator [Acerihabitans arboris]|uniref:TetR family transcriptional regulator n=1 Tax=Acerihabitans arboris TaxID=2691583 RepID=A0A845SP37_9GAMM|nr:TetR family transcriptional regulator [Acerihabitans arboris]NDL65839.1 TetR family transcriptional regulator [Acerihabitans arboris]